MGRWTRCSLRWDHVRAPQFKDGDGKNQTDCVESGKYKTNGVLTAKYKGREVCGEGLAEAPSSPLISPPTFQFVSDFPKKLLDFLIVFARNPQHIYFLFFVGTCSKV